MAFFHFSQNNSGGSFDVDAECGITHHVVIEASNADEANAKANEIGLYFDGVEGGRDCECCGDRWCPAYGTGNDVPSVYGSPIQAFDVMHYWINKKEAPGEICVHYADGRMEWSDGLVKKRD